MWRVRDKNFSGLAFNRTEIAYLIILFADVRMTTEAKGCSPKMLTWERSFEPTFSPMQPPPSVLGCGVERTSMHVGRCGKQSDL